MPTHVPSATWCYPAAFARAAARRPDATALEFEDRRWTYAEVDQWANRIANFLIQQECAPGRNVGLFMNRSASAIAVMLGVMRAGSAFVPLDPEYPVDRLAYMIADADIAAVVCDSMDASPSLLPIDAARWIDIQGPDVAGASDEASRVAVEGSDLAYIMYTSGSTGRPKGVQIEHRALATYCDADIEIYRLVPEDRALQFSTLNFDIAIEEIFPLLLVGGAVVVRPRARSESENELSALVRQYGITVLRLATAYWHEWTDLMAASDERVPSSLRMVLATGEKVSPTHYRRWLELCDHSILWCNAYGPTETTVTATVFIPDTDWQGTNMPIGRPLKGYEAWILDAQDQPVAEGQTGDLYLGGAALSRGYLNRPEQNAAAFRWVDLPGRAGVRLYKTGDRARWLPSGDIEFAGRIDHQIKLGSYRIEPAEIEYQISTHPDVAEALVVCEEVEGSRTLVAYVATGPVASSVPSAIELARYLRERLPPYMVPLRYCFVESFPKTINGKVDRPALPPAESGQVAREVPVQAPRTEVERLLVEIWSEVLGLSTIGIHDDFFALGGSSLLVARVIAQIRRHHDLAIPVRDFFANPTIASIAALLEARLGQHRGASVDEETSAQIRQRLPEIDPGYFPSGNESLFAVRYLPRRSRSAHGPAVLICQSVGHEYARAHRNLQQLALRLAQEGCDVVRFDYSGCGNSSGSAEQCGVDEWLEDVRSAADWLREVSGASSISLVGIRFGALLAARAPLAAVDRVALWDPVFRGQAFLSTLDRFHDRALSECTYYARRRQTLIPQRFGILLPDSQRAQWRELCLPSVEAMKDRATTMIVTSRGYAVPAAWRSGVRASDTRWTHVATDDEIHWESPEYTESAFSAPYAAQSIIEFLTERARRENHGDA